MCRSTYCSMPMPIAAPKRNTMEVDPATPIIPPWGVTDMKLAPV